VAVLVLVLVLNSAHRPPGRLASSRDFSSKLKNIYTYSCLAAIMREIHRVCSPS
jgi:hypothetical protein